MSMSIDLRDQRHAPAIVTRMAEWRRLTLLFRGIAWAGFALELLAPLGETSEQEIAALALGAVCLALTTRHPAFIIGELAASCFLFLEQPRYLTVGLCLLSSAHAAFGTSLRLYVLAAVAGASLVAGWATGDGSYAPISLARVGVILAVSIVGCRMLRAWLGRLLRDINNDFTLLLDLGRQECEDFLVSVPAGADTDVWAADAATAQLEARIARLEAAQRGARACLNEFSDDEDGEDSSAPLLATRWHRTRRRRVG